ncbi:TIGR04255 family protein [Neptunomonas marina]|uniref:TIGR04255 family protein n=1 Tax=Neptunomonas marina TaxID=1815562 RepID=A0A437QBM2_9GAMM|nr:TIGR04255 family protein [Neptunomonas marina]RVU31743.1 TIGR04255 family protein [Neptunomonas marina]
MKNYKKLENQPLKFALAEFRFSPVMQISEYIPRLQEALRKEYPIPDKKGEQVVQVQPGGISVSQIDRWAFISADKRSAIDINQERLIYVTADYPRFEGFAHACETALNSLIDIVEPSLILRIGLRFSDLVIVGEGETISELVDSQFSTPSCIESLGQIQQQRSEFFLSTDLGGLAIRTLYGHHNLSSLPDVQGLPVLIDRDDSVSERIILDFDHYWEPSDEPVSFEADTIIDYLTKLHDISRDAFWRTTTDYARNKKWS